MKHADSGEKHYLRLDLNTRWALSAKPGRSAIAESAKKKHPGRTRLGSIHGSSILTSLIHPSPPKCYGFPKWRARLRKDASYIQPLILRLLFE